VQLSKDKFAVVSELLDEELPLRQTPSGDV
jgi:hypothetical protein